MCILNKLYSAFLCMENKTNKKEYLRKKPKPRRNIYIHTYIVYKRTNIKL